MIITTKHTNQSRVKKMEGGWMMMKDDGCFLARGEYLLVPGTKTYLQSFCLFE